MTTPSPEVLFHEGEQAAAQGDRAAALDAMEQAVTLLSQQRKNQEVRAGLTRLAALCNGDPELLFRLGAFCKKLYLIGDAVSVLKKLVQLVPDHFEAHCSLGEMCFQIEDLDQCILSLTEALRKDSGRADYWYKLARAYDLKRQLRRAITCYDYALRVDPEHAAAAFHLGIAYSRTGRQQQALEQLGRAVKLKPLELQYQFTLARMQLDTGRTDEAYRGLRHATGVTTDALQTHLFRGLDNLRSGNYEAARRELASAVAVQSDSVEANFLHGRALLQLGQLNEAFEAFRATLKYCPQHVLALQGLSRIYRLRGLSEVALDFLHQALEVNPSQPETIQQLIELTREGVAPDPVVDLFEASLAEQSGAELLAAWLSSAQRARAYRLGFLLARRFRDELPELLTTEMGFWFRWCRQLVAEGDRQQALGQLRLLLSEKPDYEDAVLEVQRLEAELRAEQAPAEQPAEEVDQPEVEPAEPAPQAPEPEVHGMAAVLAALDAASKREQARPAAAAVPPTPVGQAPPVQVAEAPPEAPTPSEEPPQPEPPQAEEAPRTEEEVVPEPLWTEEEVAPEPPLTEAEVVPEPPWTEEEVVPEPPRTEEATEPPSTEEEVATEPPWTEEEVAPEPPWTEEEDAPEPPRAEEEVAPEPPRTEPVEKLLPVARGWTPPPEPEEEDDFFLPLELPER